MSQFELLQELFSELKFTKHNNDAFSELASLIDSQNALLLNQNEVISIEGDSKEEENSDNGRIGPALVAFSKDKKYSFGTFELDEQGHTIVSLENFVSVRANVCVFKGKWMYETLLMTNGIFQIGWATMSCPFTNEEGAGDAPDSFAYDGKRQKKWNVSSLKYGETWEAGDIIGSCIDLDNGTITFYRNGKCLGTAFQNVRIKETGLVYFPTISLSIRESAYFNFGDIPFAHPVSGYEPLQYPNLPNLPSSLLIYLQQSSYFCGKIEKILLNYPRNEDGKVPTRENQLLQLTYFHAFNILLDCYLPLLFTENCAIIPFIDFFSTLPKILFDLLFDLLENCLDVPQKVPLIKRIMWYIGYKASTTQWTTESSSIPFLLISSQLIETPFFINISQAVQAQTEEFLEKLLSVKQPNENDLAKIFPKIWFSSKSANFFDVFNLDDSFEEESFEKNGKIMSEMSIEYLKIFESIFAKLFSQNFIFKWLRSIVKRNKGAHQDILPPKLTNSNVMANLFIILLRFLGIDQNEKGDFFSHNKLFKDISPSQFEIKLFYKSYENYDNEVPSDNYFDLPRLGGSFSHLLRSVSISEFVEGEKERRSTEFSVLFDSMITLYHLGARDRLQIIGERVSTIEDTITTLYHIHHFEKRIQKQLFAQLVPYIRLLSWEKVWFGNYLENNSIFDFWTSIQYLLHVFNQVKEIGQPNLIQYVPELYIDTICEGFNYCRRGINIYDSINNNQNNISESSILNVYSIFILHFSDSNILNPDMREKLLKSISIILQAQISARLFEKCEHVKNFIQSLFHSVTSSMWYSVVMIIATFSKGHSFGIRDPSLTSSRVLIDLFKEYSIADVTQFNKLLNQLFNQLNTFATEFRKDIKDIRHFNEADNDMVRLKKRCSMIYELISKMFCVIEMIANECPQLLLESKLNMTRLSELILLFLSIPVNPPHSEYFSLFISLLAEAKIFTMHLLGPISGIMTSLHTHSIENPNKNHYTIIKSLISLEESYSPKFFDALTSSLSELDNPSLPFKITDDLVVLKEFVQLLNQSFNERSKEEVIEDEETICTICYAQQRNSVFIPCKHQSCEQCIVRHLLNNDKCFFCNTPIASVEKLADRQ